VDHQECYHITKNILTMEHTSVSSVHPPFM